MASTIVLLDNDGLKYWGDYIFPHLDATGISLGNNANIQYVDNRTDKIVQGKLVALIGGDNLEQAVASLEEDLRESIWQHSGGIETTRNWRQFRYQVVGSYRQDEGANEVFTGLQLQYIEETKLHLERKRLKVLEEAKQRLEELGHLLK
jgi:hypothetical protein